MTVMTAPAFDKAPVTQYLRPLVNNELKGRATTSELSILRQRKNLVPWLMVLRTMRGDAERTIANSRADLEPLRPTNGAQPSDEYRAAKYEVDQRNIARRRFLHAVEAKREEVQMLLSSEGMSQRTIGSIISMLTDVEDVITTGHIASALAIVRSTISHLEAEVTKP